MAWSPETYNKFKSERFAPFYDLMDLVKVKPGLHVIDLGCGTGELTRKLADKLPDSRVFGIDTSPEMLAESDAFKRTHLNFAQRSIEEQLGIPQQWDLVFSNAAVQWAENHRELIPNIVSKVRSGGQLLIQMPAQHHNISNQMLHELALEEPFRSALNGWTRTSPVLDIDEYAQLLFESRCRTMTVFEKIYPLVLQDATALFDWVSGTALLPYLERLQGELATEFTNEYQKKLRDRFPKAPVFYPFKRIILEGSL
ncbi:methyltransferase domain-containing protein [Dyadobacter aurulentus]|uniref:methyltransferase domain-containing protein n=1 Tax=Dyadobacter sp. UC 10 TaxID=2605428 RepID=UPI0011F23B18|nr:methyltransferase domain-containing protein [Dyadobacter sp. UC 10]KAA0992966.1 methyltransferase domain-containing protein [Dyadobacter sp. UC 10]